ncbi:MAG: tRNA pseudouridine(38-40) synthase TruA [Myxococcales bacterium]|nr:tRNA pseudouridine(38-40) synthase TruA [Myxococcales bacterium]
MTESSRPILLRICYRGHGYHGFQVQEGMHTIAGVLEDALAKVLTHRVTVRTSSRTDAGVHALDLPVYLETPRDIDLRGLVLGTNTHLPSDIRVLSACELAEPMEPRRQSRGKIYRYLVWNHALSNPMLVNGCWQVRGSLDLPALQPALTALIGEHDFSAFRAQGCQAKSPVRRITMAKASRHEHSSELVCFEFAGDAFVRYQVRIMVGTLVGMANGQLDPASMPALLAPGRRADAGQTAPPDGLYLVRARMALPNPVDRWPETRENPARLFPLVL